MSEEEKPEEVIDEEALRALSDRLRSQRALTEERTKSITADIEAMGAKGKAIAEERKASGLDPDPEEEAPAVAPLDPLDALLPEFVRGLRFGDSEIEQRVVRHKALEEARRAALAKEPKVVFVGYSGHGKTSLLSAALRERFPRGAHKQVAFVDCRAITFARRRHPLGQGEPRVIEDAFAAPLLVLDDLGLDNPTEATSPIEEFVRDRYNRRRALWVTTFLTRAEMCKRYGDGFARRVLEDAVIIQCGDQTVDMENA